MVGLDGRVIRGIQHLSVLDHIEADVRSDFILAPHYNVIFRRAREELWSRIKQKLQSGSYTPELPITVSVPKERWFSRPGSILKPYDRFVYQALADQVSDNLEQTLDRKRTFSHVLSPEGGNVFKPNHELWNDFQSEIKDICETNTFVLKTDISNYFERLPQHHLINLMTAAGCAPEVVKLLEELLLAFTERDSHGIIQGVFPSDILGNFYLSDLDAYCEISNLQSARYVDDIYIGFPSLTAARKGLSGLIERLRKDGLHLNEYKSRIVPADVVVKDETVIDRLFDEIRAEIRDDRPYRRISPYAFDLDLEDEDAEEEESEDDADVAVKRLMHEIASYPKEGDQIERFCLPLMRVAKMDDAVDYVVSKIIDKPHQTRLFFSYLSSFIRSKELIASLTKLMASDDLSDYQRMFLLAALLPAREMKREAIVVALQWLQNPSVAEQTRGLAAIFAARHGSPTQKRSVQTSYEGEPSEYVRSAILYSARYFPPADRKTCKRAWGGHNEINALISTAI